MKHGVDTEKVVEKVPNNINVFMKTKFC